MTRTGRLVVLGALYFAQGLPFGFFVQALPVVLRERGVSLSLIGLSSLLAMPWALKPLVAPLVDRARTRRAWIVPLQITSALLLALAALASPEASLPALFVIVALTNLAAAAQDIATDALAVDLLPEDERGLGNGLQVAGYRVGMIAGGGVVLGAMAHIGWAPAMLALGATLALATIPLLITHEPARTPAPLRPTNTALRDAASRPGALRWLRVLVLFKAGEALATAMARPMLVDRGLDAGDLAALLGGTGFAAGLAGALIGGALVPRLGRRRALAIFGALQVAGIATWLVPATGVRSLVALHVVVAIEHVFAGMATAALFTAMMDACRPAHAATDYALQASVVVLATGIASALGGVSAEHLGYVGHFVLAIALAVIGLADVVRVPVATSPSFA
ncbi:MFS transporter [Sandaracinus amylolyticus]|uniref:MFS transporter n=1 Tax=Sandaracinus amylolyticus TaxID=927083 RepID=UPI00069D9FD0|nr:MFS transporter [Sandaracinus amylolyticus]